MRAQRRINHTGRKKLDRSRTKFEVYQSDSELPSFTASLDFEGLSLPGHATVYVEAYYKSSIMRFDFGTVQQIVPPVDTRLSNIDDGGGVLFRVYVVDRKETLGQVLALAKRVSPSSPDDSRLDEESLLTLGERNLGHVPWRLYLKDVAKPELVINSAVPSAISRVKHDPVFQGLLFPAVIREIVGHVINRIDEEDEDDIGGSWVDHWRQFSVGLAEREFPEEADEDEIENWIEDVVEGFSRKHGSVGALIKGLQDDLGGRES